MTARTTLSRHADLALQAQSQDIDAVEWAYQEAWDDLPTPELIRFHNTVQREYAALPGRSKVLLHQTHGIIGFERQGNSRAQAIAMLRIGGTALALTPAKGANEVESSTGTQNQPSTGQQTQAEESGPIGKALGDWRFWAAAAGALAVFGWAATQSKEFKRAVEVQKLQRARGSRA